jgi:transformation/transcription domain-associated protein
MTADITEQIASDVVDKLIALIPIENEDNDILIVKTVLDFLRHHSKIMKEKVQLFLDIILEMFDMTEATVKSIFDDPAQNGLALASPRPLSPVATTAADLGSEQQQSRQLQKGMQSFKVLAECPIIVVSIFANIDKNMVLKNVKTIVPLIKKTLLLQAGPQERAHDEAKDRGDVHLGVCKEIKNKAAFGDLIMMQVKTMGFLAYLLRVYSGQLTDFLPQLPDIVVRMLKDCPRERSAVRKELLVAIRHIINFNFRKIFLRKLDELLDSRILIGDGLTVYETMRPLAYSMLADLIHHLREKLTKEQISKTIKVYIKNFLDDFPGTSFQTMSAKLLINMAEFIAKCKPRQDARHYFMLIFTAIADKFAAMNAQFPLAVQLESQPQIPQGEISTESYMAEKDLQPDWCELNILHASPIKTQAQRDRISNMVDDNRFLLKNLVQGLKTLFSTLKFTNPAPFKLEPDAQLPPNWSELSWGFSAEEVQIFIRLFHEGIQAFRYYDPTGTAYSAETKGLSTAELVATQYMANGLKEEKELLETFGTVFHYIDPATFHEIFHAEIPHLYDVCFVHPPLLHIAQFLLASEATSPNFCGMLLQFLMGKIDEVGVADPKKASTLLRLFKLSFMAVTLFAPQNEQVLLPHITGIITKSIQLSTTAEEPINCFLLLRSLFRSIGGGKFELLYKEILPLLEMILDVLNGLLHSARKPQDRDLFVELILTVPARLSNLLPHLRYLMRPLIVALGSGSDLVGQGLRTLELCVDNLTQDYIDPIMAPFIDDLMATLWGHLKPAPYNHFHSHTTTRILGKLGGRNRKFLTGIYNLNYKPYSDDDWSFDVKLISSTKDKPFPATVGVDQAIARLKENPAKLKDQSKIQAAKASDPYYKANAFHFIQSQVKLYMGLDNLPDDFAQLVRLQASDLLANKTDIGEDFFQGGAAERSVAKRDAEHNMLKRLIQACHYAQSIPELRDEATAFTANLCKHFALLDLGKTYATYKHRTAAALEAKSFDPLKTGEGPLFIDSQVLADALTESLASDSIEEREAAEHSILSMWEYAGIVLGEKSRADRLMFWNSLNKNFTHACYQPEWYTKMSGVLGINILLTKLPFPDSWILDRHLEIIRSLMFVLKDTPADQSARPRIEADALLETLITRVAKHFKKEELENPHSKLHSLDKVLVNDLPHVNRNTREAAQKAYAILAKALDISIADIIKPVKELLLQPVFHKPLRLLALRHQIGYLDAMTFCMRLEGPKIIPTDDPLQRLILEAMVLLDAEDENLAKQPTEFRTAESLVQLRIACMKLLSTAITNPEYNVPSLSNTWNKIICVFFRCLYVKSLDVVSAANKALKSVITVNSKLPKDVLQNGLRPILQSLQFPAKLTPDSLEGLARLLRLLTTYFKVEIGQRLLENSKSIADGLATFKASFTLLETNKPMKVMAALFDVFHLLPSTANQFLEKLVEKDMELETALRRTMFSPFREPLIRYFNQYPKDAIDYFVPKLQNLQYGRFFAQIIDHPDAKVVRDTLYADSEKLVNAINNGPDGHEGFIIRVNVIHLATAISKFENTKDLLSKNDTLRTLLLQSGPILETALRDGEKTIEKEMAQYESAPIEGAIDGSLKLPIEQAADQLVDLLVLHLSHNPTNTDLFYEIVNMITSDKIRSRPSLFTFIYKHMISADAKDNWKALVLKCIGQYKRQQTSQKFKTFLFHHVVNPIFAMDVQTNWESLFGETKGTKLVDRAMINILLDQFWRPGVNEPIDESSGYIDHARMELLQLTALLLKYHNNSLQETRKDIIMFGWHWIKLEDVVNKHAAYVVIAYFIRLFETPLKITMNVYNTLLRAHQNEAKPLVTQALELLAPVLKKRLGSQEGSKPGLGLWARLPRRIIAEEMNNLQQLISIFNFFNRQPDLFYEARDQIAPAIIPNLMKVAQSNNEAKRTSLNLVNLIWGWEERSYKETIGSPMSSPKGTKRKADGVVISDKSYTCVSNQYSRLHLIRHLNHFISIVPERYPLPSLNLRKKFHIPMHPPVAPSDFCKKAVTLLKNFLSPPFWTDVNFDGIIPKFAKPILMNEKPEDEKQDSWNTRMMNSTQALRVFVNMKPDEWVLDHLTEMLGYIKKPMKADDQQFQDCIHWEGEGDDRLTPLFRRLVEVLPEAPTMEVDEPEETTASQFMKDVHIIIADALSSNHFIAAINILHTLSVARPKEVDQHTEAILKAFSQLFKQHLSYQTASEKVAIVPNPTTKEQLQTNIDAYDAEIQVQLIIKIIDILASRIDVLGENRRPFLTTLASLVERSRNEAICLKVMDLLQSWVFNADGVPTLKEKVAVLTKMLLFEQRPEMAPLLKQFLELVLKIFLDPKVTRTELTVRMEHPFLVGCRSVDVTLRNQFLAIFDGHISRTPSVRLQTLLCTQDWTPLGDSFWLSQVIHLLFGSFDMNTSIQLSKEDFRTMSPTMYFSSFEKDPRVGDVMIDDQFETFIGEYRQFCAEVADLKLKDIMEPLAQLQHTDKELASKIWLAIFPIFWANVPKDEHSEFEGSLASVLAKDFHMRQLDSRPNCIQALLEGVARAKPRMKCPPHIAKFLAKTYDVWYVAAHYLEDAANVPLVDSNHVRESTLDALLDLYHTLDETDMFYGLWRRRCNYIESNSGLSYEQMGMWDRAQLMYENAQIKARTGVLPFSQGEYNLWEDHWVICAQKLQQWDILQEYAKHENFNDLFIEACWRNPDNWNTQNDREQYDSMIKAVSDALTPRRAFFAAFMAFLKMHHAKGESGMTDAMRDFNSSVDTAIQLSIRKWHQLPDRITNAHIPLLQNFQHLVELYDAQAITATLGTTSMANLNERSQDLKMMFATWRDRLPNFWDDINAWQDLVTWRTHVFTLVNNTFLPIIQPNIQNNPSNPTAQYSFAYRGFHEMAWIINRFAHVARQHNLPEVCISQLGKIYTLPNIEIQEAFIKLREQAKCHYQNRGELNNGLDVIMNTNLSYFSATQKSEFYTLKGMFLNKLDKKSDANEAFGSALYFDIRQAKAWREWAKYSDQLFKEDPKDLTKAANAISCYLEAASCYKNRKARPLLGRVLWLLSLDNSDKICAAAFRAFKNEQPLWYWISYVPQLLLGLSRPEAPICAALLDAIAKTFPQALFFQLRTTKEDLVQIRKQQEAREAREKEAKAKAAGQDPKAVAAQDKKPGAQRSPTPAASSANGTPAPTATAGQTPAPQGSPVIKQESKDTSRPGTAAGQTNGDGSANGANGSVPPSTPKIANKEEAVPGSGTVTIPADEPETPLKPWEYVEKVMGTLKASHPFLSWSLESIGDQITKYFKPLPDEDAHRLIVALLNDSLNYLGRTPALYGNDNKLPPATEHNISKFTENVCPPHIRQAFFNDFVKIKPTMYEYVQKLRKWRSRFEERLDRRRPTSNLETLSVHLADFKFTRLEDVEIPGQYLDHKDKNTDFVKIDRFLPDVDLVRGPTNTFRRLKIRGHDGSIHAFAVQTPTNRYSRREERILQLLRLYNDQLDKSRETRRRNLKFNLPAIIPVSPTFRLIQDDESYVSLQGVYEDWCRKVEVQKDDPVLFQIEKQRAIGQLGIAIPNGSNTSHASPQNAAQKQHLDQINTVKLDTYLFVTENMVPNTVALEYFSAIYPSFADFWLFRKTFATQLAALTFATYALFMSGRSPSKFMISRGSGKLWGTDLVPSMGVSRPVVACGEAVPFRFTPSMQMLLGPITTEGVFVPSLQAVARALTIEAGIETIAAPLTMTTNNPATGQTSTTTVATSSTGSFMEQVLALFLRDECQFWLSNQRQALQSLPEAALRELVAINAETIIRRAMSIAQVPEANNLPSVQTVVDLVSGAVSPKNLCMMEPMWMAWL